MGRVASTWAAAAAALALAACGDARVAQTPLAAESSCAGCHTAPGEGPPFRDQTGSIDPHRQTVGAHDLHLHSNFAVISCGDCHTVPQKVTDPGHLDAIPPQTVQFGTLARTGGAHPVYNIGDGCAASYCHGNFRGGNRTNTPQWIGGGAGPGACGTCHGMPPPSGRHPEHRDAGVSCDKCHGSLLQSTHVNGTIDVPLPAYNPQFKTCAQACHLPRSWPAPGDAGL
jgi:predicted CxxxxCH...CXXCH cytochrome family protein